LLSEAAGDFAGGGSGGSGSRDVADADASFVTKVSLRGSLAWTVAANVRREDVTRRTRGLRMLLTPSDGARVGCTKSAVRHPARLVSMKG
jgi:hypothetical protein